MADNNQSSYRSIFKTTSLFGGVQAYQILIQIIKSKFVAVLLGPAGVGIMGLYQSGLQLIQQLTSLGISQSAVRDVAEAMGTGDKYRISLTVQVVKRLVWITGLLGLVVVAVFSPLLSMSSFGNYDYTGPFIILSVTLLLDQLCAGQRVVLQGMRELKALAKCSAYGVTFGLFTSIPIYYLLGISGIVPTLLLNSICSLFLSWVYSRKVKTEKIKISTKESLEHGRTMLVMGVSMSINGILSTGTAFAIRGYIQNIGGVDEVGLYQSGSIIMNTYVGLIMNAIATDYYPRLAAVNKDNEKCRTAVSQQGEIGTMILAPMLICCLVFMPFVLQALYSVQFLGANEYISWACLGMLLRLASWVISYMIAAKAESKLFIVNELAGSVYYLLFSIVGYKYWGLQGVGAAFALNYIVYFMQVYLIARHRYQFRFSSSFIRCYGVQLLLVVACLATVLLLDSIAKYAIGITLICISCYLGFRGLNQRMDLTSVIKSKLHK